MSTLAAALLPARDSPWRDRVRTGAMVAGVLAADVVLAAAIVNDRLTPLLGLLALALAGAVIVRWPMVGFAAALVLGASVFTTTVVVIPVGPTELRLQELAITGLLVLAIVSPRRRWIGGWAGRGLLLLLAVLAFSTILAVQGGQANLTDVFGFSRTFYVFALFFAIVRLLPEPEQLRTLLVVACAVAALSGLIALAVAVAPAARELLPPGSDFFLTTDKAGEGFLRVRLPGVALAYGLLPFAVVAAVRTHGVARLGWTLATAGMAVGVATSFNRNMWLGAVLGAGLLVLLGGAQVRRRLTVALVLVVVGTAFVLAQGTGTSTETPIGPLVKRATTLLDPRQVSREDSLRSRDREASRAWRSVEEHPILGVGVGVPFGVSYLEALPGGRVVRSSQLFLHNQYLYFLVVAGIPGLAALLWFLLAAAAAGLRARADPLAAACVVGLAMLAFSGLVMIAFAAENMITALCVVTAACVVYGERFDRIAEGRRTGRSPLPGGT